MMKKGFHRGNGRLQSHDTKWCDNKNNLSAWFRFINVGILSMPFRKKRITKQLGKIARWIWRWGGWWRGRIHLRRIRWIWDGMKVKMKHYFTNTAEIGQVRWGTLYYKYEMNYFKFNLGESEVVKTQYFDSSEWHIVEFYKELRENLILRFFGGFRGWWLFLFFFFNWSVVIYNTVLVSGV